MLSSPDLSLIAHVGKLLNVQGLQQPHAEVCKLQYEVLICVCLPLSIAFYFAATVGGYSTCTRINCLLHTLATSLGPCMPIDTSCPWPHTPEILRSACISLGVCHTRC